MDKTALVGSDLKIESRVLEALKQANIPVKLYDWNYNPDAEEWRFTIATPWYDTKGPREVYLQIFRAQEAAGTYKEMPIGRITVVSPNDPLVKILEQEIDHLKEGSIHIIKNSGPNNGYSVIFSPYSGPEGAVPAREIADLEQLREFLEKDLNIDKIWIDQAIDRLARTGRASIPNVQLTQQEAKKLGLA